jgi:hypothetical protein
MHDRPPASQLCPKTGAVQIVACQTLCTPSLDGIHRSDVGLREGTASSTDTDDTLGVCFQRWHMAARLLVHECITTRVTRNCMVAPVHCVATVII